MKAKRILLTGDDGYNSIGIRVLARLLKGKYSLAIAASKEQQSGVGGLVTLLKGPVKWGKAKVEGVEAVWVDGSPSDAIELAQGYFKDKFDLVLSGINWGENLGVAVISSATFCAAVRAIGIGMVKHAVALSYLAGSENWLRNHSDGDDIEKYLEHPGETAVSAIERCIKEGFYGADIVNVNIPVNKADKYKMTRLLDNHEKYYTYPVEIDYKGMTFKYPDAVYVENNGIGEELDAGAVSKGYISITPIRIF